MIYSKLHWDYGSPQDTAATPQKKISNKKNDKLTPAEIAKIKVLINVKENSNS